MPRIADRSYHRHRDNAKKRGTPFLLSLEDWYDIWLSSGYWDQRGPASDQYCMARFGDQGAYEIGNVKIITNKENRVERNMRCAARFGESNPAFGRDYWAEASPEERVRRLAAMSKAAKIKTTGRRMVTRNEKRTWAYPQDFDYPNRGDE